MNKRSGKKLAVKGSLVAKAIKKINPIPFEFLQALRLREWSAMEALQKGSGTIADVALMMEMLLMCEAYVAYGVGPEAKATCDSAEKILDAIDDDATLIRLSGDQMQVIRELHAYHDQQREISNIGDYEKVISLVDQKARAIQIDLAESA